MKIIRKRIFSLADHHEGGSIVNRDCYLHIWTKDIDKILFKIGTNPKEPVKFAILNLSVSL